MRYFGLTGGVACGKTTVARMFKELGARIVNADETGHELLQPPLPTYRKVVRHFGKEILDASGEIDRKRLGAIVFADSAELRTLNAILHPQIIHRAQEMISHYHTEDPHAVILVDAALILEAGIGGNFHKLIVVWCRPEQQVDRFVAKTGLSRSEAQRRIAAQMPAEEKRRLADFVIDCSGDLESTQAQVAALYPVLESIAGEAQG